LTTFTVLAGGLGDWVIYGVLRTEIVIISSNSLSLALLGGIIWCKLRPTAVAAE
jgi:hypothetical protein